jgi:hypothetical protein
MSAPTAITASSSILEGLVNTSMSVNQKKPVDLKLGPSLSRNGYGTRGKY